ncbi:MAG: CvpA family protein [Sterolibacterium sp.]|jgi:membrane protein required for colicin V production|nr:CvpA family protein [Sterolibacterium sp.]
MSALNWLDLLILTVVLLSTALGLWRGLASEILALLAWLAAFLAARAWGGTAAELIGSTHSLHDPGLRYLAGFVAVFCLTLLAFALARWLASNLLRAIGLGLVDRLLGALFGCGRALLIVWIGVLLAGLTALPRQDIWRDASLIPPLETAVIASKPWLPPMLAQKLHYRSNTKN